MGSKFTPDSLLLLTDFNSFCSKKLVREISAWFEGQFIVVNSSDRIRFCSGLPEDDGLGKIGVYINKIAKKAGIFGSEFSFGNAPEMHRTKLMSVLK